MLAPPHPRREDNASRASTRAIPSSIGQEETVNEDYTDSGHSGVIMDHALPRGQSPELSSLPSAETFNRELDFEHDRVLKERILQEVRPSALDGGNISNHEAINTHASKTTLPLDQAQVPSGTHSPKTPPQTPPQTPPVISIQKPTLPQPEPLTPTPSANEDTFLSSPSHIAPHPHATSPPPTRRTPHHHRRFVRWVKKRFRDPWSINAPNSARERNRVLRWINGQGL